MSESLAVAFPVAQSPSVARLDVLDGLIAVIQVASSLDTLGTALQFVPQIVVMGILSMAVAVAGAIVFRWYARVPIPDGIAILLGLSAIALVLNTTAVLAEALGTSASATPGYPLPQRGEELLAENVLVTIVSLATGTIGADLGRRVGDRVGIRLSAVGPAPGQLDAELGEFVKSRGRVIRVTLPTAIEDIDGYDPVADSVKADLAGSTLVFPRRVTREQLRSRLVDRLKTDTAVSAVDVDLAADGTVEYLALGSRVAGLGVSIPPGHVAVAIRADPAFAASPGDTVQVWRAPDQSTAADPDHVADAELRAAVDDVVTLIVDRHAVDDLAAEGPYRLVTMPAESTADREFASLLRAADETMSAIEIESESPLLGLPVGALDLTILAVRRDGDIDAIPAVDRQLQAGDVLYAIGRTDTLRTVDAAARETTREAGRVAGTLAAGDGQFAVDSDR